ncbi:Sugar transferase involved in LPS biosynthesis (colanic, teichoic acid) [Kandleria vitulina]|uniref:Sugar transferase involved in LPS biosynthesis (Colanic, teichoic acid) n=1 Tax=Kandleria vitulina TaxID=1630 RepID=A0A1H2U9L4_9FIRM|nr:sugar transferase [Kandleria vitulina]SDW52578.1 Sugar transferase involved in LPS biosynthesis (colanic, teichoic acid) [Kandleria vitulina]
MSRNKKYALALGLLAIVGVHSLKKQAQRTSYQAKEIEPIPLRKQGFYERRTKRLFDITASLLALIIFSPLYLLVALLVRCKLGSPVLFTQERPGLIDKEGKETIFKMYKFRTMTDERDEQGQLLSDEKRLTKFGKWLRSTSLDELPEVFNILNGTMSVVGPRPQLVRDMVFMSKQDRIRHSAKPGLSGLAQVNGRNAISWEDKLSWDRRYVEKVSFLGDLKIILLTVKKAFIKQEGISMDNHATALDYGDYLLESGQIEEMDYDIKQFEARKIQKNNVRKGIEGLVSIIMPSYNTATLIKSSIQSVLDQTYRNWELIIVDDCSTDHTQDVLKDIHDPRITIIYNKTNEGAAMSRNKALRLAKGQWMAFLDSDDLWHKDKLEKQLSFMNKNNYSFSYTNYEEINHRGDKMNVEVKGPKRITMRGMYRYCWMGCLTVMYDANKVGVIQIEDIKKNNDYAMWLKVSQKCDCFHLDETLASYRRGRLDSISSSSLLTLITWHYRLFRIAEKKNPVTSILCTLRNMIFGFYKKKRYVKKGERT